MTDELKKTALFNSHVKHNAKLVPFAGYSMPVQYESIVKEHEAVRNAAGLFDVSHMGVATFKGKNIHLWVNDIITKDISKLNVGQGAYSCLCFEHGGTVDDLIVYRKAEDEMILVFNASNKEKDFNFFMSFPHEGMELQKADESVSLLALQGPLSSKILAKLSFEESSWPQAFEIRESALAGIPATLLFTGYTGEAGCEIAVSNEKASQLWEELMKAGQEFGLQPCGLGARDTLRLEMGFSLYGHELSDSISPVEAGIGWCVGWNKEKFSGKKALESLKTERPRKIVALRSKTRQAPRQEMPVLDATGKNVGVVTSGTFSPTLNAGICLALVDSKAQAPYKVELRSRELDLELTRRPFITKE